MTQRSLWALSIFSKHRLFWAFLFLCLTGCSQLLFYPEKTIYVTPQQAGYTYREFEIDLANELAIHAWLIEPESTMSKGTVIHLHGNAQNMSTHMQSVIWLTEQGYNVLMMDYPGFGHSEGESDLRLAIESVDAVYQWAIRQPEINHLPLYMLGQSLGATIAAWYVAENSAVQSHLNGVILDAPFASYHDIAREKMAGFWLTWPLQYPISWLLPERFSPIENAEQLHIPVLIFASRDDDVIPLHHSKALFNAYDAEKHWVETTGQHIATFDKGVNRQRLLDFMRVAN